jgi:hypothetical protein
VAIARPDEEKDVGYRTISRLLIEAVQNSQLRVNVEQCPSYCVPALIRKRDAIINSMKEICTLSTFLMFGDLGSIAILDDLSHILPSPGD